MARLFLGWWPDATLATTLRAAAASLAAADDGHAWRVQRDDQWHLTLRFFGDWPDAARPRLDAAIGDACDGLAAAVFRIDGWLALPDPRRARVLALRLVDGGASGALAALGARLEAAARAAGAAPEPRVFVPHVTLARARAATATPPVAWPAVAGEGIVDRVALVESTRDADGSRYRECACWPLPGGAASRAADATR